MRKNALFSIMVALVTIVFLGCGSPVTPSADTVISIATIPGVTAPVTGATPVTIITETNQYTGKVAWNSTPTTFAASTQYTATISLTAKAGYTLSGVAANFFTVAGASTTNAINSGLVTAVFPTTGGETTTETYVGAVTLSNKTINSVTVNWVGLNKDTGSGTSEYYYTVGYKKSTDSNYTILNDAGEEVYATAANYNAGFSKTVTGLEDGVSYDFIVNYYKFPSDTVINTPVSYSATTAIDYGYPAEVGITVSRSEITGSSTTLHFTAPTVDSYGNPITIKEYQITIDGTTYTTTASSYTITKGGTIFSDSQTLPNLESVNVRAIANETTNLGTSVTVNARKQFSTKYGRYQYLFDVLSSLSGNADSSLDAIGDKAAAALALIEADSAYEANDTYIEGTYASKLTQTEIDNGLTYYVANSYDDDNKNIIYIQNYSDVVTPDDFNNTINYVAKATPSKNLVPNNMQRFFDSNEGYLAYAKAERSLMPKTQREALVVSKFYGA